MIRGIGTVAAVLLAASVVVGCSDNTDASKSGPQTITIEVKDTVRYD